MTKLLDQAPEAATFPQPFPFKPRALLSRGPLVTPAPADTSFVRGPQAMVQPPNPARALPAGPEIRLTPPPADTSFVRGPQGMNQPPNPARALPPAPNIRLTEPPADTSFVRSVDVQPRNVHRVGIFGEQLDDFGRPIKR